MESKEYWKAVNASEVIHVDSDTSYEFQMHKKKPVREKQYKWPTAEYTDELHHEHTKVTVLRP